MEAVLHTFVLVYKQVYELLYNLQPLEPIPYSDRAIDSASPFHISKEPRYQVSNKKTSRSIH